MKTKAFLVGNLARDLELRKANLGNEEVSVATLTVMNNDNDETNVYDVSVWRGLADSCAKYLKKGDKVIVEAIMKQHKDKDVNYYEKEGVKVYDGYTFKAEQVEFPAKVKEKKDEK